MRTKVSNLNDPFELRSRCRYRHGFLAAESGMKAPWSTQLQFLTPAVHPGMLGEDVTELYCGIVESVGSVPWGLGIWQSDEHAQWYFTAVWLAMSYGSTATEKACAASKVGKTFRSGGNGLSLWYHAYDRFCEQGKPEAVMCGLCNGKGKNEGYDLFSAALLGTCASIRYLHSWLAPV